jgi:hypothetical protein
MNIRFQFEGGAWDGRELSSGSRYGDEAAEARRLYELTEEGSRLSRFVVPDQGDPPTVEDELANPHQYLVTHRAEQGDDVVIYCHAVRESEREAETLDA